jgi:hypothetical protein
MFHRAALGSLLIGLALAIPAAAQVNLGWKFAEGDTFFVEEKIDGKTTVAVKGVKAVEEQSQRRVSRFLVKSVSRDDIVVEQRILEWKSTVTGGSGGDQDDSKLMEDICKDLVFTLHLSATGSVTRFDGSKAFVDKLSELNSAEAKMLKAVAVEDLLRAPLMQIFEIVPGVPAKSGQNWQRGSEVSMGPMGNFKLATTFTYTGFKDGAERISTRATFSFQPSKVDAGALGLKIQKLDLTTKEATGLVVFDNVKGRLVLREMNLPVAGTMVVERLDEQIEVQFDGLEKRTIRMMDKRPK